MALYKGVKVRLSNLSYPIKRDTRAIYFAIPRALGTSIRQEGARARSLSFRPPRFLPSPLRRDLPRAPPSPLSR